VEIERGKVGLIVLNWNGQEVLPLCLASLERAADQSGHEVSLLVVDNASGDGSPEWVRRERPRWELVGLDRNLGFAGGTNRGLEIFLGRSLDYLCVLNNDIEADIALIDPLVADLAAAARRGAVSPRIHYHEPREWIWYGGGKLGRLTRVARHEGIRQKAAGRWLEPADTGSLTGCCIMGRAEFWRQTGGFDEAFGLYAEDVDLSLRARALGWTLRYQPAALLYHRIGFASGGHLSPAKLRAQRRAVCRLVRRHVPLGLRPLAYLGWAGQVARGGGAALLRGERGVFVSLLRSLGAGGPRSVA